MENAQSWAAQQPPRCARAPGLEEQPQQCCCSCPGSAAAPVSAAVPGTAAAVPALAELCKSQSNHRATSDLMLAASFPLRNSLCFPLLEGTAAQHPPFHAGKVRLT